MTRSSTRAFSLKTLVARKIESMRVVLPWSMWATMARLRILLGGTMGAGVPRVKGLTGGERVVYTTARFWAWYRVSGGTAERDTR